MAELSLTPVKPCVKCGACERYSSGACKACARAYGVAKYAKNPHEHAVKVEVWRKANLDKVRSYKESWKSANQSKLKNSAAEYRASNKVKIRERDFIWRSENKEKVNKHVAKWQAANPDRVRANAAAWRVANSERAKAQSAAWAKANPESIRVYVQNRRARKIAVGGTLSKGLSKKLFNLQNGKCPCCSQPLGADFHMDHIMPLALGGSNTDDNIQLLRQRCNNQKHTKHPIDFMQSRGKLL